MRLGAIRRAFQPCLRAAARRLQVLRHDQRGFSLTEELVSLAVLALAVGVVIAGIFTGSLGVRTKQGSVNSQSLARSQVELIVNDGYHPNPTAVPYPSVPPVSGYTVAVEVEYWRASTGTFISSPTSDGMQRVTVRVSDADGQLEALEQYMVER